MKKTFCIILFLTALCQAVVQAEVLRLHGIWQTELGECQLPGTTDENQLGPGNSRTDLTSGLTRLWPYVGIVNYTRRISLPRTMEGQQLELYLERSKTTTVWVDGDSVGTDCHLLSGQTFLLPPLKAGMHELRIRVDNRDETVPQGVRGSHTWSESTQTNWNGILGRMELRTLSRSRLTDMEVYPDVESRTALVTLDVMADHARKANVRLQCGGQTLTQRVALSEGRNTLRLRMPMGQCELWSEFHPTLYTVRAQLDGIGKRELTFGMRQFGTDGTQFTINGLKTFLRGTHDACVFPLTAYCPTDVETWAELFTTARTYGLNHFRFHSYTPTEAAFHAADSLGIYLQVELPGWGTLDDTTTDMNELMRREAEGILREFGHHPSFMALGIGNELSGDHEMMRQWVEEWRKKDNRHLYTFGSNNTLGWQGVHPGEDYMVTCRVGGGNGYTTHTRSSFSHADAQQGGLLNNTRPNTRANYLGGSSLCPVPVVSHETCQFQIYPDYSELPKYTGVLYPYNLETFRDRLKQNDLTDQIQAFHEASGRFAVACDRADIEYCLRTPGFGGYQMLDIKDYPGQGTALVGVLDAFGDSKGLVTPEEWCRWVSPVVPLALMDQYCWSTGETFVADLQVSNFSEEEQVGDIHCTLTGEEMEMELTFGDVPAPQGGLSEPMRFSCPLITIQHPGRYTLRITYQDTYVNEYSVWIYPDRVNTAAPVKHSLAEALKALERGEAVILQADSALISGQSFDGLFTPDYWNYTMFRSISLSSKKPVSGGTLGLLMDPAHPLFKRFPTEGHSDWQWWPIARFSRPLILDKLAAGHYRPTIQAIDNIERNHLLGILMEFKVGAGRLLLTTTDLGRISEWPEGRAYVRALVAYTGSTQFQPKHDITASQLTWLLTSTAKELRIKS